MRPDPRRTVRPARSIATASAMLAGALMLSSGAGFAQDRAGLDALVVRHATRYNVPERLVRRIIMRESRYNAAARNGPYWGLMQIRVDTARGMGYRGAGPGLLDADTNLTYAVAYLANAYTAAGHNEDRAVTLYASGYYFEARRKGLLPRMVTAETVPGIPASSAQTAALPQAPAVVAAAAPPAPAPAPAPARQMIAIGAPVAASMGSGGKADSVFASLFTRPAPPRPPESAQAFAAVEPLAARPTADPQPDVTGGIPPAAATMPQVEPAAATIPLPPRPPARDAAGTIVAAAAAPSVQPAGAEGPVPLPPLRPTVN